MRISTKGRYALRVMIDLASFGNGSFIALKDISQRQNIPIKYLEQIVSTLNTSPVCAEAMADTVSPRAPKNIMSVQSSGPLKEL